MIRTLLILICASPFQLFAQVDQLKDFPIWQTGRDPETIQLIPISGDDPLVIEAGKKVVHVKFQVKQYGEVYFPIDGVSPRGTEAQRIDLSSKKCIKIRYRANHEFVLQLRQTGIHGCFHYH